MVDSLTASLFWVVVVALVDVVTLEFDVTLTLFLGISFVTPMFDGILYIPHFFLYGIKSILCFTLYVVLSLCMPWYAVVSSVSVRFITDSRIVSIVAAVGVVRVGVGATGVGATGLGATGVRATGVLFGPWEDGFYLVTTVGDFCSLFSK